jgi:hypothetical protein
LSIRKDLALEFMYSRFGDPPLNMVHEMGEFDELRILLSVTTAITQKFALAAALRMSSPRLNDNRLRISRSLLYVSTYIGQEGVE